MSSLIDLNDWGFADDYGPIGFFAEESRQSRADDDQFYRSHVYYFELQVPKSALASGSSPNFIFPLVIPPQSITIDEPFQVNQVQTLYGGLYVEESGVNARTISIEGTTGFQPKLLEGNTHAQDIDPKFISHYRKLQDVRKTDKLSGQKQFQFLQDRVFRAYADLKRSPIEAKNTELYFHMPHMGEHWRVVPMNFQLTQDADTFPLYKYSIQLLAVPAEDDGWRPDSSQSWLQGFRSALTLVRNVLGEVRGALEALNAIADTIAMAIQGIGNLISDVGQIIQAAENFVNGITGIITAPATLISRTADLIDDVRSFGMTLESVPSTIRNAYENACLELQTAIEQFGTRPDVFQRSVDVERSTSQSQQGLSQDESGSPLSLIPGVIDQYPSVRLQTLTQGQTLESLAAELLGDVSLWPLIAEVNDLKPPFFSPLGGERLPGTLMIGDEIAIPSRDPIVAEQGAGPLALGVMPDEGPRAAVMGTDLQLTKTGRTYDLAIDFEHGATDMRLINDIDNVEQAIKTRMRTTLGEHPNFPELGAPKMVGVGNTTINAEISKMRIRETIQSDPRVKSVDGVRLERDADKVFVEVDATIRSVGAVANIQFPVRNK